MQRDIVATEVNGIRASQIADDTEELAPSSENGSGLSSLLRTVQRKALLIIGLTGIAVAGTSQLSSEPPPSYSGYIQMLVEPVSSTDKLSDPLTLTRTKGAPNDKLFNLDYPTQLQILQSPAILEDILKEVQTQYPDFTLIQLQESFEVKRVVGANVRFDTTKILEVKYEDEDQNLVKAVLEATAKRYLKYSEEERNTGINEGIEYLDQQLPELQTKANNYQAQIQRLQQQYQLMNPQIRGEQLYEQIQTLTAQRQEAQRQLQQLRTQYNSLQAKLNLTPEEALAASALSEAPNRNQLLASLTQVEDEIAKQSAIYNSNTPEMQVLQNQRQNLLDLLGQETQQILGENSVVARENSSVLTFQNSIRQQLIAQMVDISNQTEAMEVRLASLTATQSQLEQQAQIFPTITRRYNDLRQQLELTTTTLNQFLTQREKLRLESAQDNVPWEILAQPQIEENLADSPMTQLMMGAFGGLAAGIGLAILLEKLHNIFYTIEDLKAGIKLPLLGVIPRQKVQPSLEMLNSAGLVQATGRKARKLSEFMDAFDGVYANLRFLYTDTPLHSLAVCSAESGDGKSTVAMHLAQTVASMGQKVLLVDANLRHPQLHHGLGLPNQKGLSNLLTDAHVSPSVLIQQSSLVDNLFVLTAGAPLPQAVKLLGSEQMRHIAAELQKTFDLVIYDTPELRHYTDATFLSGHLDGMIMVVGIAKTHKSVAEQIVARLNQFNLPCLGVVANHMKRHSSANTPYISEGIAVTTGEEVEQLI